MYKVAEMKQKYDTSRSFLLLTYKLYNKLDELSGPSKGNCLNVILSLLKYAWKSSDYKCAVRYSTIIKDTKLSKMTVRRSCRLLADLGIIKIKRLSSANLYSMNSTYLKAEVSKLNTQKAKYGHSEGTYLNSINKNNNYINLNNTLIEKIMKKGLAKDAIIKELSELPFEELKSDKTNIYYCNLAIALKEELLREKNLVPTDKILTALKNTWYCKYHGFQNVKGFKKGNYTDETRLKQLSKLKQFKNYTNEQLKIYYEEKIRPTLVVGGKSAYNLRSVARRFDPYGNFEKGSERQTSISSNLDEVLCYLKKKSRDGS
jgi:hypothetical protein